MILALQILGVLLLLQANVLAYVGLRLLVAPRQYDFPWLSPALGGGASAEPAPDPDNVEEYLALRRQQREAS